MKTFSLEGHCALVTGSTRGIGAAIADGFEQAGAAVLRHGRQPEPGQKEVLLADLGKEGAAQELLDQAFARHPELDLLVCNAGSFFDVPFLEMDHERFAKTFRLNVEQVFFMVQGFGRELVKRKRSGAVVIISSTNSFHAEEHSAAYDSSKGALLMLTRSSAMALAPHGIRVNGVAPGLIVTPLTSTWINQSPDLVKHYEKKILAGRIGDAEDCAGACVFLCSDAARYIIGQTIVVDGGLTVGQIGRFP